MTRPGNEGRGTPFVDKVAGIPALVGIASFGFLHYTGRGLADTFFLSVVLMSTTAFVLMGLVMLK